MATIPLRQIRAVIAVCEEGSFTRAAPRENATQSGISQHIAAVERAVGVKALRPLGQGRAADAGGHPLLPPLHRGGRHAADGGRGNARARRPRFRQSPRRTDADLHARGARARASGLRARLPRREAARSSKATAPCSPTWCSPRNWISPWCRPSRAASA